MIKVYQNLTVDNDGQGNCLNACIASLLELPLREVADILPRGEGCWFGQWNVWLAERGHKLVFCRPLDPPKGFSLATVHTERVYPEDHPKAGGHIAHMCIAFNGRIFHDPYPFGSERYELKYFQELRPLTDAESALHKHRAAKGFCIHGYVSQCERCSETNLTI